MEYVTIGKIVNTHGIKGDLKVELYTDFPDERFAPDSFIYIGDKHVKEKVKEARIHKDFLLLKLEDKEDINLILPYKNQMIYKSKDDIKPLEDGYYFSDLKGLDVYNGDTRIGTVIRVEEGVSSNYLRVKTADKEVLVPFIEKVFISDVDLENKRISINVIEGLL